MLKSYKNFTLLVIGRMISDTGTGIQMVIMPLYIIDAGGSAATIGLFSFLSLVPALIIYPFAGVVGDRLNRKNIMVVTDFVSAVVILGLAFVSHLGKMSLSLMLLVMVIVSLLYGLYDPATKGMVPQLVEKDHFNKANSMVASMRILSALLSPVIGTMLYVNFGITMLFVMNGISFLLSSCCSFLIQYNHTKRELTQGILNDLSSGIKFMKDNNVIRKLCLFFLVMNALIQPAFSVALPLFFKTKLSYSDTQYGYLQMVMISGALLGSMLLGVKFSKEKNMIKPIRIGCILLICSMLLFSILLFPYSLCVFGNGTMEYLVLLALILGFTSFAFMFLNVPVQTFIQKVTPDEYMSRIFSIVGMLTKGGMPLGAMVYGSVLSRVQVYWTVLTATLFLIFISIVFLVSLLRVHDLE